ncbi:DUF5988 family protein [Micromonospora zamorensis]|uniref:DUF5988 family protein n=1 Tax=Micromonospora zamorensis TaxID=709883 RepID=UPI000C18C2E6|nr:DUF5988 family protein [Micromonospora zamorensis]WSK49756.1 DUF5988 family protein [Micromonospora zamorensis]
MSHPDTKPTISVVLEGGPADLPAALRRHSDHIEGTKIKILHLGGYEHFERISEEADGSRPVVFRWTMRTRIAE